MRLRFVTPSPLPVAALALLLAWGCRRPDEEQPVRVAAASDLSGVLGAITDTYQRRTGRSVSITFGSTGLLARQLQQGAPFDLFAAADASYVDAVVRAGACDGATRAVYARGRLALWRRATDPPPPSSVRELADPRYARIALANPEHAPYGRAAREAMASSGVWDQVRRRLVLGENVRQALQVASTGNADVALVALANARAAPDGAWTVVDAALHTPLEQTLVVCRGGRHAAAAAELAELLRSSAGLAALTSAGFDPPSSNVPTEGRHRD